MTQKRDRGDEEGQRKRGSRGGEKGGKLEVKHVLMLCAFLK